MELLVDENSPLVNANLRALILDPEVWKLLSPEQVAHVQKYWPGDSYNGDLTALASNDHLRHDIAQYQNALSEGRHDPEWIKQAQEANKLRNDRFEADKTGGEKREGGVAGKVGSENDGEAADQSKGESTHDGDQAMDDA